jgi:type I restriction enzyme S subunit
VDAETGLPEGWKRVKLGEVVDITSSKRVFLSDYVDEGIPFYRGKEIILKSNNDSISSTLFISEEKFEVIQDKYGIPRPGDILITAVGTLGYPYLVTKGDGKFYFKDGNLIWLKKSRSVHSSFLIYMFKSISFREYLNLIAIGSSQKALTIKSLKLVEINLPDNDLVERYAELSSSTITGIENLQFQNKLLKEARDLLLPRLMTGLVDVEELVASKPPTP